jgi:uncharacterized protein YdeI (YjbR/CyaY-like superfamily)
VLIAYIFEAIEVGKAGLKVKFNKSSELLVPEEIQMTMNSTPSLKMAFHALTTGWQRAYILYFSAQKKSKTRAYRIEKCVKQILKGRGLNDRYIR